MFPIVSKKGLFFPPQSSSTRRPHIWLNPPPPRHPKMRGASRRQRWVLGSTWSTTFGCAWMWFGCKLSTSIPSCLWMVCRKACHGSFRPPGVLAIPETTTWTLTLAPVFGRESERAFGTSGAFRYNMDLPPKQRPPSSRLEHRFVLTEMGQGGLPN